MIATWAAYALLAAVFWGLAYTLAGRLVIGGLSTPFILSSYGVITVTCYVVTMLKSGTLKAGMETVAGNWLLGLYIVIIALSMVAGQFLIYQAINLKDAPHAVILEITYPVFTFILTWLLFRDVELSWSIIIGGLLIFAGASLILFKANN